METMTMNVIKEIQKYVKTNMKNDSAHDYNHIIRVYKNVKTLCKKETANEHKWTLINLN